MARPATAKEPKYLSGPELIERWRLDHTSRDPERFLRFLRERGRISRVKPTPKQILYLTLDVVRLEEEGTTPEGVELMTPTFPAPHVPATVPSRGIGPHADASWGPRRSGARLAGASRYPSHP